MATRIALEQELQGAPDRAFAVLSDRGFTQRRLALEPALAAQIVDYSSDTEHLKLSIAGELPAHWMPAGVDATPRILRQESWRRDGERYSGSLSMSVHGMPIRCEGTQELLRWGDVTVVSLVLDLDVSLPFVGQTVERMIRDRIEPAFAAEFDLLATEVARSS